MHTQVRRFIKTGIAFFFVGLVLGVWLMVAREAFGVWPSPYLVSAHTHALLAGFVMFLILGVAQWLFPRAPKEDGRYRPEAITASYWVLVTGTSLRVGGEVVRAVVIAPDVAWVILAGGLLQALGFTLYFWSMWSRIRPVGSALREARGERF
jgi:heme/copper-type cytochrome/quinol oxidase subunit 1